jgi:hypothetical protein
MPTDAVQIFPPGFRVLDSSGTPISGAKIKVYDAGTLTPRTVYSNSGLSSSLGSIVYTDSAGVPVASQGSGTAVMVYTGSTAYKIVFTTSADVAIITLDNIKGALDTSTFLTSGSTSTMSHPASPKTGDYTIVAADRAKIIAGVATGGTFTLTLTSAVTLGDGWFVLVTNTGTANPVKIAASQVISGPWGPSNTNSFALRPGEGAFIGCNGVGFIVTAMAPALLAGTVGIIEITDRVSAAPVSPVAGARYIVTAGFSTYEAEDIIEADGAGGFFEITPPTDCGWLAYVQDENEVYQFQGSAWVLFVSTALATIVSAPTVVKAGGLQLLTSGSAAGATLDIVLTAYTGYSGIKILLIGIIPQTDAAEFYCRLSSDGGATYDATGYSYGYGLNAEGGHFAKGSTSANQIEMFENVGSAATEGLNAAVELLGQTSTARWSQMFFSGSAVDSQATPVFSQNNGGGTRRTAQDTDAIRFLFSTGNIASGTYRVYGYA